VSFRESESVQVFFIVCLYLCCRWRPKYQKGEGWHPIIMGEETEVPGENQRSAACHRKTLSHSVASSTLRCKRDSISQL